MTKQRDLSNHRCWNDALVRLFFVMFAIATSVPAYCEDAKEPSPRFRIESPSVRLIGVPVHQLRIVALTPDGKIDEQFNETAHVEGVRLIEHGEQFSLPKFEDGVLEIQTDRAIERFVSVTSPDITIAESADEAPMQFPIHSLSGWQSLAPPLIAIILAIWWQEVIGALFMATLAGMMLLSAQPFSGFVKTIDPLILSTFSNTGNGQVILFTMFLGAMIGVMSGSGGTQALVDRLKDHVQTRQRGQLMTWVMGLVIFFDDYGNTLLVGSTMRSITDRLRISREKLAFLVDSTAAPVAGLALVSTWVGVEVGYIRTTYEGLGLPTGEIYQTFLATIPYRFYPILLLIFVLQIAWTGRDFGPMLKAERKSRLKPLDAQQASGPKRTSKTPALARHAIIPLITLCVSLGVFLSIDFEHSSRALLLASSAAVFSAVLSVVLSRSHQLSEAMGFAVKGMQQMLPAVVVLVLAWCIGTVCDTEHLNTAGYLVESLGSQLSPHWLPAITFLLAALISFATGTSYGTMGLLIPLFVAIQFQLLQTTSLGVEEIANHPLMLATIGAVLGGAIFGDHCSPISDTTILSSAATGCDHLSHVRTQLPYSLMVAGISLGLGYVALAFGVSPYLSIPVAVLAQWLVLRITGRDPEQIDAAKS